MTMTPLTDHPIADLTARYQRDADGRVGLMLFPTSLESRLATRRTTLRGEPAIDLIPGGDAPPAIVIDPLAHVKIVGDSYPGAFAQGRTMRCSESNDRFRFAGQHVTRTGQTTRVITTLAEQSGLRIEHTLSWTAGDAAVEIRTAFTNGSTAPVALEMLTSFSIGGITPFGLPESIPLWVDARVMTRERIVLGGGSRACKVVGPPALLTALGAEVVDDLANPIG